MMMYGSEVWPVSRRELGRVNGENRNENAVVESLGVACITDKMQEDKLRW